MPPLAGLANRIEYATAQDPSLNYCLWPYEPPAPAEDKLRSVNLLYQSFDQAGVDPRAYEIADAIREGIGPFRTVFGVKLIGQAISWEYYFYDYKRLDRDVSIPRVLGAIDSLLPFDIAPNERLPYFMFSLDMDAPIANGTRPLDVVHMYIGNPGSAVSSGISYALRRNGIQLENFYFFFDARTQGAEIAKKIASSAFFEATHLTIDSVLVPELRDCRTLCLANKQTHDCIYFSGVDVDQLLWFLLKFEYPDTTVRFVRENRSDLDHLLFDVGFDYRVEQGQLRTLKSGYYGVF